MDKEYNPSNRKVWSLASPSPNCPDPCRRRRDCSDASRGAGGGDRKALRRGSLGRGGGEGWGDGGCNGVYGIGLDIDI